MSVSVTTGRDHNTQDAPYASVSYGPLLFALPIPDTKDPNTPDPAARWNYALDVQGDKLGADVTVEHGPMPGRWDWPLESPLKLRANAVVCDWSVSPKESRLPPKPIAARDRPQRITLDSLRLYEVPDLDVPGHPTDAPTGGARQTGFTSREMSALRALPTQHR